MSELAVVGFKKFSPRPFDGMMKPSLIKRFEQVIKSVRFKSLDRELIVGGGENGDGHFLGREGAQNLKTIRVRHLDIEKQQIRFMSAHGKAMVSRPLRHSATI